MNTPIFLPSRPARKNGAALLITLALLVLLLAVVLAFFSRVTDSGKATVVAASQTEVNLLTKSALDLVLADLRTEMISGSGVSSASNQLWMKPNNTAAWSPYRQVKSGVSADANFQNLVKQSVAAMPFFPAGTPYSGSRPTLLGASALATSEPSTDRQVFSPARWGLPALTEGAFTTAQVPDWIYVTRNGVAQNQTFVAGSKDPKSPEAVLGRFAFNIYDISGLLDINVAGFPTGQAVRAADKGGLPWSVLDTSVTVAGTTLPLASSSPLLSWRNPASSGNYEQFVAEQGQKEGFLSHQHGDRKFDTRSDLIRYASRAGSPIDPKVLPLLTTFSRMVNAPSWTPVKPPESSVSYESQADQAGSSNRNIAGVRVLADFTRRDGRAAKVGDQLVDTRFPLSKLDLFRQGDAVEIQKYFGLTGGSATTAWQPDLRNGRIRTLAQVAQANREPNFFELLKAGILTGALGGNNSGQSLLTNYESDLSIDRQILQIGANLIDQYDEDSVPTWISTLNLAADGGNTGDAFGIENHPFISAMFQQPVRRRDEATLDANNPSNLNPYPWVNVFLQFQIWNPHLNASVAPGGEYRIIATEGVSRVVILRSGDQIEATPQALKDSAIYFGAGSSGLNVNEPQLLNTARINVGLTSPLNMYTVENAKVAGLFLGRLNAPHNVDNNNENQDDYGSLQVPLDEAARLQVQWKSPAGIWVTVQELGPLSTAVASGDGWNGRTDFDETGIYNNEIWVNTNYLFSDPRTHRYGIHGRAPYETQPDQADRSLRPAGWPFAYGKSAYAEFRNTPYWAINGVDPYYGSLAYAPAELAENDSSSATSVKGTDNVLRRADSTKAQNVFAAGSQGRPYLLNRPFRSVGEMAYAFRDEPWKTLDFFTEKSGDGALLELFSVNEAPVQAGVINLNRASSGVIEAVLSGALQDPAVSSGGALNAKSIADGVQLAVQTVNSSTLPLTNRSILPNVVKEASLTGFDHKRQREVIIRAFGDVTNLRTWNLLIDLVVQSGKIGLTGTSLRDFAMRAERRIWAHVAIDRVTGEIVELQVETVNE